MGKVKKLRQKYHLSLKKDKSSNNVVEISDQKNEIPSNSNSFNTSGNNIFAGVQISLDDICKTLPKDLDARSIVSSKSRKELKEEERHLSKKEKKKLRHERFLQKLDVTHQLVRNSKLKKKQKKNLGNGMTSLLDALPQLQPLDYSSSNKKYGKAKAKPKGILKTRHRLKQQALDKKIFKNILNDKMFKENPLQAVNQYLKQKVAFDT